MDADHTKPEMHSLVPGTFGVLCATLVLLAAVPAAFWLNEVGLLPWPNELRWEELRAQSTQPPAGPLSSDRVTLARQGCFGPCPVYTVSVFASGRIEFDGVAFVCAKGAQTARIEAAVANELLSDLESAGFFTLTWFPGELVADAPSATTTLVRQGRTHRTDRKHDDPVAPRILRRMESAIDQVAGTSRWLPRLIERDLVCEFADGSRRRIYDLEYPEG